MKIIIIKTKSKTKTKKKTKTKTLIDVGSVNVQASSGLMFFSLPLLQENHHHHQSITITQMKTIKTFIKHFSIICLPILGNMQAPISWFSFTLSSYHFITTLFMILFWQKIQNCFFFNQLVFLSCFYRQ